MKAKVIIENGLTSIYLTPENDFEIDVIEKLHNKKQNYDLATTTAAEYNYGRCENYKIAISLTKKPQRTEIHFKDR